MDFKTQTWRQAIYSIISVITQLNQKIILFVAGALKCGNLRITI